MLIRIRSNVGVWRVEGLDEQNATVQDILKGIAATRPHVVYEKELSSDPAGKEILPPSERLSALKLRHGSMVFCRVDPTTCADQSTGGGEASEAAASGAEASAAPGTNATMRRVIDQNGSIRMVPTSEVPAHEDRGFRKGMMPLRDMKMQWTCTYLPLFSS